MSVHGWCDPRFEIVRLEFERNLAERGELGASVCVTFEGETVVDLWGGVADLGAGRAWEEDTMALVMSTTKGAMAWCANLLADRGDLDMDAPLLRYWPEFAKHGKDAVTTRMVLSHTAGLPHVRAWLADGAMTDWEQMVELIADEELYWEPGTRQGYHAMTFGFLVGETIRRITGRSPGRFFADEVARPLGLDFFIGLPDTEHHRVAPIVLPPAPAAGEAMPGLVARVFNEPQSILGSVFLNNGGFLSAPDQPRYYRAEIPAGNGIANARGVAGLYRPLANGGEGLIGEGAIVRMGLVTSASLVDATLGCRMRFTTGFHKSVDNRTDPNVNDYNCFWSEDAFGHAGNGGSLGFADPRARISFGYVMNQLSPSLGPDERAQSLIDAVYTSLGYRSREAGVWA